ncbi:hypothetical protein [Streptomyces sp. WAC05858]|uniref:hypothetical protein n=1 Tax=Streptomyces sp. WAC05858 TaxID=2487409 RepID=UPI00269D5244|nr:hypothetical protein [Streptomyces sp. WAC05858]
MKRKHPLRRIVLGTAATVSGVVLLLALKQPGSGDGETVAQNQPGRARAAPVRSPATSRRPSTARSR